MAGAAFLKGLICAGYTWEFKLDLGHVSIAMISLQLIVWLFRKLFPTNHLVMFLVY